MQIWAESGKSALPICNYSQILYQFLMFTQNLKRSRAVVSLRNADRVLLLQTGQYTLLISIMIIPFHSL